jgi:hypothetical protein
MSKRKRDKMSAEINEIIATAVSRAYAQGGSRERAHIISVLEKEAKEPANGAFDASTVLRHVARKLAEEQRISDLEKNRLPWAKDS